MDSPFRWLWLLPLLELPSHLGAGGSLGAPQTSVLALIGERAVLPCRANAVPVPANFSIHWTFHGHSGPVPVGGWDGNGGSEDWDECYRGRAGFFRRELRTGNASLLLGDVRSSDRGFYSCRLSFAGRSQEQSVQLEVAAIGESPRLILHGRERRALAVSCRASGWFPRPELLWLDRRGELRPESGTAAASVTSGGLFGVEGSVRIQSGSGSDLEIWCRVLNRPLNASRETRIRLHDVFLPSVSRWLRIFLAVLFLNLALISAVFCLLRTSHKRMVRAGKVKLEVEEEKKKVKSVLDGEKAKKRAAKIHFKKRMGELKGELDFWEVRSHAAPVSLDPTPRLLELGDARAPLPTAALLGREALGAGKRYWEVELGRERRWALGVTGDGAGGDRRSDRWGDHRTDQWGDHRGDHRSDRWGDRWSDHRGDRRNDPQDDPRNDPRNDPRDDPRDDHRNEPWGDPRGDPRDDPRNDPRSDPRSDPRADPQRSWALRASQGRLFCGGRAVGEQREGLSVLGVLLDPEEERLEFYDVEKKDLVARMALGDGEEPPGKFFPFVSQGEEGPLRIRPVPIPGRV